MFSVTERGQQFPPKYNPQKSAKLGERCRRTLYIYLLSTRNYCYTTSHDFIAPLPNLQLQPAADCLITSSLRPESLSAYPTFTSSTATSCLRIVESRLIQSISLAESMLPRHQMVNELVLACKSIPDDAARAAVEVAEEISWTLVDADDMAR